jgi:PII-like signaling protein
MSKLVPSKIVRIHMSSDDRFQGRLLYEAIVDECRSLGIAGATVFAGVEGFGESAEILRANIFGRAQPVTVTIVDTAENTTRLLPTLREMVPSGLVAISDAMTIRIQKTILD